MPNLERERPKLTVGALRKALEGLSDATLVVVDSASEQFGLGTALGCEVIHANPAQNDDGEFIEVIEEDVAEYDEDELIQVLHIWGDAP
jgi:hypothetical protein